MLKKLGAISLMIVFASFLLVGCGKKEESSEGGGGSTSGKKEYAATGSEGTISGTIKFEGDAPAPKTIPMGADAFCASAQGDKTTENVVVTDGKLANVFVYVKGGPADEYSYKTPTEDVELDQQACRYHPHVLGVQTGQPLKILNNDQTTHNIHPTPHNNPEWNEVQAAGAPPKEKKFNKMETLIPVKCNQHPWMQAYIGVLPHPFFAVSGKDGSYTIKGLPPGDYTVVAWHEQYGEQTQKVTVGANDKKTQDFSFSATKAYAPTSLTVEPALVLP